MGTPPAFGEVAEARAKADKEKKAGASVPPPTKAEKEQAATNTTRSDRREARKKEKDEENTRLVEVRVQQEKNEALRRSAKAATKGDGLLGGAGGGGRGGERRATAAFLNDPTMQAAIDKLNRDRDLSAPSAGKPNEPELDESELQQLRGVFAAQDDDKDGYLTKRQLKEALLALGFNPTDTLMNKYHKENLARGSNNWKISLPVFLAASSTHLDSADDCSDDIHCLFEQFDPEGKGVVTAGTIRHLLHETLSPTRLSRQEMEEFMDYANLIKKKQGYSTKVRYDDLIDKLLFV